MTIVTCEDDEHDGCYEDHDFVDWLDLKTLLDTTKPVLLSEAVLDEENEKNAGPAEVSQRDASLQLELVVAVKILFALDA